jgi:phage head maturation protease
MTDMMRVRAQAQGRVTGYVAIWGSPEQRDEYETYFDKARPPAMGIDAGMHRRPILYEHALQEGIGPEIVGVIEDVFFDETGIAFNGQLDPSSPYYQSVMALLKAGKLATSSATMTHTAAFHEDGAFKTWLLGEVSLTTNPAELRMPAVVVRSVAGMREASDAAARAEDEAKSTSQEGNIMLEEMLKPEVAGTVTPEQLVQALVEKYGLESVQTIFAQMQPPAPDAMSAAEGRSAFFAGLKAALDKQAGEKQMSDLRADMDKVLKAMVAAPPVIEAQRTAPAQQATPALDRTVSEPRKFWGKSGHEMAFAHMIMRARNINPSAEFLTILGARALKEGEKDTSAFADPAVRSLMPKTTRANEVATSTATGGGDEWVSIAWSTSIWEKARNNRIFQELESRGMRIEEVPQGAESIYILTEGSDPTVYTIAQDADLAASGQPDVNVGVTRIGTGRTLLTPGELGMAVAWTDVFEEDSIINVVSQYSQQMDEKAQETIEQLFINGDTDGTANTNINLIDGTPGTGLAAPYYLASDGALKFALVPGTGTSRDGGSVLDETDFRLTHKLLPSAIRTRKAQTVFIVDPDTHSAALEIPALKTDDVRRTNATIQSGVLTDIWGVDVMESGFMPLANSAGKVPNAGGTLGRILCVYVPFFAMGWKRRVTVETDRYPLTGTNVIVAKMRLGFKARGSGAATVSYNFTV